MLLNIEYKKQNVVSVNIIDSDMLVVNCGRFIQYGLLDDSMFNDDENSVNQFHFIDIDFGKDIEITKIWSTDVYHNIQIVARDLKQNIMIVVTWDCTKNIESAMF